MNFINKLKRQLGFGNLRIGTKPNRLSKKSNVVLPKTEDIIGLVLFRGKRTRLKDKSISAYHQNLTDSKKSLEKLIIQYRKKSKEQALKNEKEINLLKRKVLKLEDEKEGILNEIEEVKSRKTNYSKAKIEENQSDEFKEKFVDLIEKAKIQKVFQRLKQKENLTKGNSDDLSLLMYRYSELEKKELMGLLIDDECQVNKNKIVRSLILFINSL